MTSFLSHLHADLRGSRLTRRGATHDPKDVPLGLHKKYDRMEKITLPDPDHVGMSLSDALEKRSSYVGGTMEGCLSLQEWGNLLGLALKKRSSSASRNYPSGGALYPIETYLIGNTLEQRAPAVFHYNPSDHALEKLWDLPSDLNIKELSRKPENVLFSTLIVFTSVWKRSASKYGDFTYLLALLEAGHVSQNILLVAAALGLSVRPMGEFSDEKISKLLDLDDECEQPVHSITLCRV